MDNIYLMVEWAYGCGGGDYGRLVDLRWGLFGGGGWYLVVGGEDGETRRF